MGFARRCCIKILQGINMSYKSEDKVLVVKAVKALLPVVFSPKWRNNDGIMKLAKSGHIFPGKLVEDGLIDKSKGNLKPLESKTRSEDYNDYSDAKFISVSPGSSGNYSTKMMSDAVKNKKGALRIVVYEQIQNKLYYFYFPRRVWKDFKCGPNIPFDKKTGDPKDANHWWQWEVDSFIELARIKKEDWINVR